MSDTRFALVGVALVFAGFLILGAFGSQYNAATIESQEFGDCYEYFEDRPPQKISCEFELLDKTLFFALVIGLVAAGIVSLIKGVRGSWDQRVRPEDMVGPGGADGDGSDPDGSDKAEKSEE